MTPKGAAIDATDLIEVSTLEAGSYVTRSVTGQELIDGLPSATWGSITGTLSTQTDLQTALDGKQDNAIMARTFTQGANVTGTTSEVQVYQLLIPANTFSATDKLSFFAVFSRTVATTLVSIRAKISTSATMPSGATSMIARLNPAASNIYAKIGRDMIISGGNVKGYPNNTTASSDLATATAAISSQAMDVTADNYFYLSVQLTAAGDDVRLEAVEIKNI